MAVANVPAGLVVRATASLGQSIIDSLKLYGAPDSD